MCSNGVCVQWEEVCDIVDNQNTCRCKCYDQCYSTYDQETRTSYYNKICGFAIHEPITMRVSDSNCTGAIINEFTLMGAGTAAMSIALPMVAGIYDICAESNLIETVQVEDCGAACSIVIPVSSFIVDRGVDSILTATLSNAGAGGTYLLSLNRWEDNEHTVPMDIPSSLQIPSEITVDENGSVSFNVGAINPQPTGVQNHWANVIVKAQRQSDSLICEGRFDFDVRNISVNQDCEWENEFSYGNNIYGRAVLGLLPNTVYPISIVDNQTAWTDGMAIPTTCTHCTTSPVTSFTTDSNGDMACGTLLWANAQANLLPAKFDIVIDVNGNGIFDIGTDFLDSNTIEGFQICLSADQDGISDDEDNCPSIPNGPLLGTCAKRIGSYPNDVVVGVGAILTSCTMNSGCSSGEFCQLSQGDSNDNGCGDTCECYADVNGSGKVDLTDLVIMKGEFLQACPPSPCTSDINGDGQVDLSDLVVMKIQFLKTGCPSCP